MKDIFKNEKIRQWFILIISIVVYLCLDARFFALLLGMSLAAYLAGRCGKEKKYISVLGIVICIGTLAIFKYYGFFVSTAGNILGMNDLVETTLVLPIGLSFYSLRAVSYIADIRTGKTSSEKKLWEVMLYIMFFPSIICGPITKSYEFFSLLANRKRLNIGRLSYGMQLFALGALKKVVIADRLGYAVDSVYKAVGQYSGFSLMMTAVAYSVQIYCDFSGYSDMAIAVAYILGFDLPDNFNLPYIAKNSSEFWKRWHISLSRWFMEYVYIPLGGNRKGLVRTAINLIVVMVLSGMWHGSDGTFILWGALHGVYAVIGMMLGKKAKGLKVPRAISSCINFVIVTLLWIPFRAESVSQTWMFIRRMFTLAPGIKYVSVFTIIYFAVVMIMQVIALRYEDKGVRLYPLDLNKMRNQVVFFMMIFIIICFGYFGQTAFIYGKF